MKPVCYKCHRFFRPQKNGFPFIEGMPKAGKRSPPGLQAPESWVPYKLWLGDLWRCEGCKAEIIIGTGHSPIAEQYQERFKSFCDEFNATFQVNDC